MEQQPTQKEGPVPLKVGQALLQLHAVQGPLVVEAVQGVQEGEQQQVEGGACTPRGGGGQGGGVSSDVRRGADADGLGKAGGCRKRLVTGNTAGGRGQAHDSAPALFALRAPMRGTAPATSTWAKKTAKRAAR